MSPASADSHTRLLPLILFLLVVSCRPSHAEVPWAEAIPWSFLDREPSMHVLADQFDDRSTGWQVGSLGISAAAVSGERSRLYLRWRYLSFSRGGTDVLTRWPGLSGDGVAAGWPGEDRGGGWSRPELGYLGRGRAPLAGDLDYGATIHLPFSRNDLYPFSARSISLRFAARKSVIETSDFRVSLRGGLLRNLGAAGEDLADAAFPPVRFWGVDLGRGWENGCIVGLDFASSASDNSSSRVLTARLTLPIGGEQELEMGISRELAAREDRLYATRLQLRISMPLVPSGDDEKADRAER